MTNQDHRPEGQPTYPQPTYELEPDAAHVLLIRHGQSAPFIPGRPFDLIEGHGDPALSPLGLRQATQVGNRLASEPITAIYTSSLTRTKQTADPLATRLGITPSAEHDLREINLGVVEGGLLRELSARNDPIVTRMRAVRDWGAIPEAESNEELRARTSTVIDRLADKHTGELIAVFCHGGVIGALLGHATGAHPFNFTGSRHTGVSHLVISSEGWRVRRFNDNGHAGSLSADETLTDPAS